MQPPTRRAPRLSRSGRVWKVVGRNTPSSVPGSGLAGPAVPGTRPQDTRPPQVSDEGDASKAEDEAPRVGAGFRGHSATGRWRGLP